MIHGSSINWTGKRVRLTDEEMKALRPDVPACGQTVFECDSCSGGCPIVASAQLKKVGELHRAIIETDDSVATKLRKVQDFWQSLSEEVKE